MLQLVHGQGQLNVTFRPSFNDPIKNMGGIALQQGGGFGATISYCFIPRLAGYGGYGHSTFNPEKSSTLIDHITESGYHLGLQFLQPFSRESKLKWLLSAGAVFNHIETEDNDGEIIDDSGHGFGWEAGVGLSIPLNKRWQLIPDFRYHELPADMSNGTATESVDLHYISIGVGVSWTLVGYQTSTVNAQ